MPYLRKVVLNCRSGATPGLDALVKAFISDGVTYVGVVGKDAALVEDIIDELCVGDGSSPYDMLTASHPNETLEDAVRFAESLRLEIAGPVQVVDF